MDRLAHRRSNILWCALSRFIAGSNRLERTRRNEYTRSCDNATLQLPGGYRQRCARLQLRVNDLRSDCVQQPNKCAIRSLSPQAYEFEIQPYEEDGYRGDAALWTPVLQKASDFEQGTGPIDPSPLITATELSPSTTYRFRVRAWLADGVSTVSDVSEMFTTGESRGFERDSTLPPPSC